MTLNPTQIESALKRFDRGRWEVLVELANDGPADGIAATLLVGIGLRESNLRNLVGDGGHGRGFLQIDDRSHQTFLASHAGCSDGSWQPRHSVAKGGALTAGFCPGLVAATQYAQDLLRANWEFGKRNGVKDVDLKRFAVAAYNCGAGNALRSYREGNVDKRTAGGNYSGDVLHNQVLASSVLDDLGWR